MYRQILGFITGKPSKHPYPEHMIQAREIAAEGMVLLKNENEALPLKDKKVALFGAGANGTISCGTGSGYVYAPYVITLAQGLKNAGLTITSESWLKRFSTTGKKADKANKELSVIDRMWSGLTTLIDDIEITEEELISAKRAEAAIYVVRRNAGENDDRKAEKGDYYLSDIERDNILKLTQNFTHTIVVLNTCVIDVQELQEMSGVHGILFMGLAGCEGGNAVADILTGKVNPSGKLTDTWAKCYEDNPASQTFGKNDGDSLQEDYTEDIFVGYRYFDSFGVAPLYPFGYGLSYTEFQMNCIETVVDWEKTTLTIEVKNCGDYAGKEVVQIYISAPEGRLSKPYQELKGFAKTKLLQPGETQTLLIKFATENLASYDEEKAAYIMEAGAYIFRLGNSSRNTSPVHVLHLDNEAVLRQLRNELLPDHAISVLRAPKRVAEALDGVRTSSLQEKDCSTIYGACAYTEKDNVNKKAMAGIIPDMKATLVDVKEGRVSIESFVASLDEDVLLRLVTGNANETPYSVPVRMKKKVKPIGGPRSSGATTSLFAKSLGIPNWQMTDGPGGLHLPLCGATSYPVGMLTAQTWNEELAEQMGCGIGMELEYYNHSVILGPGLNIHRDPLCGRNFEYYSEDPLITGKIAAAATRGVQKTPGAGVSIKHFACNNQEANRLDTNSTVSERALREIYLKGFEICVREAAPQTVMTSYNKLNGIHTSSNYELLSEVLRGEWGFEGIVMTDWGTKSDKVSDLHAGNDLIMGGYRSQFLKAALHGDTAEFAEDGYVIVDVFKVYGGFFTEEIEHWNTFELSKEGHDVVSTTVKAGVELNPKVADKVKEQVASIEEKANGEKVITYKGFYRGATLSLTDVQACACRILTQEMKSISYQKMMK